MLNKIDDFEYPLAHSINWNETKQILKDSIYKNIPQSTIIFNSYNSCKIIEFPGDCGCLILIDAYKTSLKNLEDLLTFASKSGYSKIICTLSSEFPLNKIIPILKSFNFKIQFTEKSNRSTDYYKPSISAKTYLCYKIINPENKGYV